MTHSLAIRENLHFLLVEILSHLTLLNEYLEQPSISIATRLMERRGYMESLRRAIQEHSLRQMTENAKHEADRQRYRSIEVIATQLERMAELCRESVMQGAQIQDYQQPQTKIYRSMLERVDDAVNLIEPALLEQNTIQALKIGKVEGQLNQDYQQFLKSETKALKKAQRPTDSISQILLAHHIKQLGDALRVISEAVISISMGQHFSTERYHALTQSVEDLKTVNGLDDLQVVSMSPTRSGSTLNALSDEDAVTHAVFKDGRKRKLKAERQRVEDWHEILPGLAPKILSYRKQRDSASLLIEHLAGETFEQILLHGSAGQLQAAFGQLTETLKRIWRETRSEKPARADYIGQLDKRLPDVYTIHPEFQTPNCFINGLELPGFRQLIDRARQLEKSFKVPFSVYIHGDFNVDNIIYDAHEKRINFIDLHRSRHMDYLQDVSVFMVSCYRLKVFDPVIRRRIQVLCHDFYRFSKQQARKHGDDSFEIRLTLGLIRSFVTSTRFILDKSLSRAMYSRAVYLMQRLLASQEKERSFKLPIEEVFLG